jgi:sugar/nucleoside kinase (ribokinase family)
MIPQIYELPEGRLDRLIQPGRLFNIGAATISTGGPVSNTGLALHRLGIPTRLIAKVGDDPLGGMVRSVLNAFGPGLDAGIVSDSRVSTSYTIIVSPPETDRCFWHCPAANDAFCAEDVSLVQAAQADLFHFGYPPLMKRICENGGRELIDLYRRVKATGVTTSLDMSFPDPASEGGRADWRAILSRVLPFLDVFVPSIEETLFMLHRPTHDALSALPGGILPNLKADLLSEISAELMELGAGVVLIKTGVRGAYLRTAGAARLAKLGRAAPDDLASWADQELWAPCFKVNVVGTTGSGDATIAGFLSGLLRGLTPRRAMTAAVAVGACNVEAADALGGLRTWEDTLARVGAGWERYIPHPVTDPGWVWNETDKLWEKRS